MSYDLWVSSPQGEFVRKDQLRAELLAKGWEVRLLPAQAFWEDWAMDGISLQSAPGPLNASVLLVGWAASHRYTLHFAELFQKGATRALQQLRADAAYFGTCPVHISRYDSSTEGSKTCGSAQTEYSFSLSERSNRLSWDLTHAVWRIIAELSDGEAINPQEIL